MITVPRSASRLMRAMTVSVGTGLEKSSYSLQYVQDRLHLRIGMMCAMMGWRVEIAPQAIMRSSRNRRANDLAPRRNSKPRIWHWTFNHLNTPCGILASSADREVCDHSAAGAHPGAGFVRHRAQPVARRGLGRQFRKRSHAGRDVLLSQLVTDQSPAVSSPGPGRNPSYSDCRRWRCAASLYCSRCWRFGRCWAQPEGWSRRPLPCWRRRSLAFHPTVVEYFRSFKQYGGEVAATGAVLWAAVAYFQKPERRQFYVLLGVTVAAMTLSYPTVFLLPGLILAVALGNRARAITLAGIAGAVLAVLYWLLVRPELHLRAACLLDERPAELADARA